MPKEVLTVREEQLAGLLGVPHATTDRLAAWCDDQEADVTDSPGADACGYTLKEQAVMLHRMRAVVSQFYAGASDAGCHALIEFTGIMSVFVEACARQHQAGRDFAFANTHGGTLSFEGFEGDYLGEKLECIFGPALREREEFREALINALFKGDFCVVGVERSRP